MSWPVGRFPTIPEYYKEAIDHSVDLVQALSSVVLFTKKTLHHFPIQLKRWSGHASERVMLLVKM